MLYAAKSMIQVMISFTHIYCTGVKLFLGSKGLCAVLKFVKESKNGCFSVVCGPIWMIIWWMAGVGHRFLATRWHPDLPAGALLESKKGYFV